MKKIVFLGDSITDAFHKMNVDEEKLGNGYVKIISEKLKERKKQVFIRNAGHDGFTVSGLLRLFEYDCMQHDPDLVSIQIGCNDAAVFMNTGKTLEAQEFAENYRRLLRRIKESTRAEILCMGPFIFPHPLEYANWIPVIKRIEEMESKIARDMAASFLPLHDILNRTAEKEGYDAVTADGTHLTRYGAGIVADLWIGAAMEMGI